MKTFLPLLLFIVIFSNCTNSPRQTTSQNAGGTDTSKKIFSSSSGNWVTYSGILPCADCSGLKTVLSLRESRNDPILQFQLKETYVDAPGGDKMYESRGLYKIIHGTKDNPEATIYQLNPDSADKIQNYLLVNDSTLRTLDKELNTIDTKMNMDLKKQK